MDITSSVWFAQWTTAHARYLRALGVMRHSKDRSVRGAIVRTRFAAAVRLMRQVDAREGRYGGRRYILSQTGR